jgi:hypothetical protein
MRLSTKKFANENEQARGGGQSPPRVRTCDEHASPTAARDRGCVCTVLELEGARNGRATPVLKLYKALEKLVEAIDRLEEKIKIDRGVQIADGRS